MEKLKSFCRRYGILVLGLLHFFGLITILGWDQDFFAAFTPLNLLITTAVLIGSHQYISSRLGWFFILCFLLGYGVELLGTKTGFPFGSYHYGENLSPLVWGVPVVIGLNWFLLTLSAGFLVRQITSSSGLQIALAALLMVGLDFLIEQVAPPLDYWHWLNETIPWMNYLGWFIVSIIMQLLFKWFLKNDINRVAAVYYPIVVVFFIILNVAL